MPEPQIARRQPLDSLSTRLILFVFAATFATALVVSWASIQSTHEALRGVIDRIHPLALQHSARRLHPWLSAALAESRQLAEDRALRGRRASERRVQALADAPHLEAWLTVGRDGEPIASVGASADDLDATALRTLLERPAGLALLDGRDGTARAVTWWPDGGGGGVVGVLDREALAALFAGELPDPRGHIAWVDEEGRVLAWSGLAGSAPLERLDLAAATAGEGPGVREYDARGHHVIGAARPFGEDGGHLVVETPFEAAFGPVLEIVSRIFVTDLVIILLFSFLAYRVTARVVRPIEQLSDHARRIAGGQIDLEIPEPNSRDEIGLLTRTFNDMVRQLRRNQEEIETTNQHLTDRNSRLQQANEVLNQLSITDGLTRLHNHRYFQDHLTREIKRAGRTEEPLSILLIDIDDFKKLNDRFGHAAGDELLSRIAQILNDAVRESDLLARYGGEEFVILASNTDLDGAYMLAEKVRMTISESSFILDDSLRPLRVTVSVGLAEYDGNRKRFFQRADQALYRAKAAGKDCVVVAGRGKEDAPEPVADHDDD